MLIKSVKNKDYGLLVNKVKINMEQGYIVSRLKNSIPENFYQNTNDNLWYYKNYKKDIKLIDIFYPNLKIKSVEFKNNDYNDYLPDNLIIKLDEKYENSFFDPPDYTILEKGSSVQIKEGACAGEYRNMYWKVKDYENNTYYVMHIKDNVYTKISKRDINKVLTFNDSNNSKINYRPTWRLFQNGYVCCTISNGEKQKVYYLHQLIMDVHNEDLTDFEKTVDHINRDKLDNRRTNLRLVNMSVQNTNRDKQERRVDACDLPQGIQQTDLPKYVVYRKEILDKEKGNFREYFYICNHPNLDKNWETTKSQKITIGEKLKQVKLKLQEINGNITEKEYIIQSEQNKNIDLPTYIRLATYHDKLYFIFEKRDDDNRLNYKMILKSVNIQNELNNFIDEINKKYPKLFMEKYQIKNLIKLNEKHVSIENEKQSTDFKLILPSNFTFFKEANGGYQFGFSKSINGKRLCAKSKLQTSNIQNEFDTFVDIVNKKFSQLKLNKYQIPNIPNNFSLDIQSNKKVIDSEEIINTEQVDNTNKSKPVMPTNFSICSVNNVDYIQFSKVIDNNKYQYKTKINSYDLTKELENFIDQLNEKYDLDLDKNNYKIANTNGWKTTNKIIDHTDSDIKLAQRERTQRYLEKQKESMGVDEFNKQKAQNARKYREKKKEHEIEV